MKKQAFHAATITLGEGVVEWQAKNLEHMRYEYELKPDSVVYDVGSFEGEFSQKIFNLYGCTPVEFEATKNRAAWIFDGELEFGGDNNVRSAFTAAGAQKFGCVDLAKVIKVLDQDIDLLKINIEGGEYGLISHLIAEGAINRVKNLQVQFHLVSSFDSRFLYKIISRQLAESHEIAWRYAFCWESWKRKESTEDFVARKFREGIVPSEEAIRDLNEKYNSENN